MVYRFERYGNEIKYGAMLTVRDSQIAIFVNEGLITDLFEPGLYKLETNNLSTTSYRGERGDSYQVLQQVVMHHKGRRSVQTRMVTKVRWRRVSGNVYRFFDDVLVGANKSLPRSITD